MPNTPISTEKFSWIDMFRALWYFLKGRRTKAVGWQVLITTIYVIEVFLPPYLIARLGQLILTFHAGESLQPFYLYALTFGIGIAIVGAMRNISRLQMRTISIDLGYNARVEGFERLMNFSYAWHQEENSGVRVQRITTGVTDLRTLWNKLYLSGVNLLASLIGSFALFSLVNWSIGLFFAVYLSLILFIEWSFNHRFFKASDNENAASEKTSGTYYESASNALTVKALGVQEGIKKSVIRSEQQSKDRALQTSALNSKKYRLYQVVKGIGLAIFLMLVARQVANGILAAPFFITYYLYYMQMSGDASTFGDFITDLTDVRAGIGRMMPIFWAKQDTEGTRTISPHWKRLVLNNASFTYPGSDSPSLSSISMSIERGQKVGIAGRSGEGKSTLAKLLLSVYSPDNGSIEIGGVPLHEIRTDERIRHISAVLQETELFSLSMRENITVFRGDDPERIQMAIRVAQLTDLIAELPNGLDTQIGEKGYKLSGGQRQRVGIARAIYARSDIIVMDEATSSLDSTTEAAVQQGIEQELGGRTLIMIAHRLSTLQHADIIYFVADGSIVESGTFDELIAIPNGLFREQYNLQRRQGEKA